MIYRKRKIFFFLFFHDILGVEKEAALKDACKIEHTISDESLAKLIYFVGMLDKEPALKKNIQKKTK